MRFVSRRDRSAKPAARGGFTLIELLTVIGIIVVIMGMLVPALFKANKAAARIACASNLRQVYSCLQTYAGLCGDRVPLGYDFYSGQNFVAYEWYAPHPTVMLGLLTDLNLVGNPRILFCPAQNDPMFQYNTDANPWVFGTSITGQNSCFGYGTRPVVNWEDCGAVPAIPKLTQLGGHTALLADIFPTWSSLATCHGNGINVCYSDGSVQWVDANPFLSSLKQVDSVINYHSEFGGPYWPYDPLWLDITVMPQTGLWTNLDLR